jgi:hypothetical protein
MLAIYEVFPSLPPFETKQGSSIIAKCPNQVPSACVLKGQANYILLTAMHEIDLIPTTSN